MNGFWAVFRKELTQMIRDRGTFFFALFVPVGELILFGVIDMNAKNIPTVVFDQSKTQESRTLVTQFGATSYLQVIGEVNSRQELQHAIVSGVAQVAIEIPPDYARNLASQRQATVSIVIDGSDSTIASQALNAANGVALQENLRRLMARAGTDVQAIDARPEMLFNPDM